MRIAGVIMAETIDISGLMKGLLPITGTQYGEAQTHPFWLALRRKSVMHAIFALLAAAQLAAASASAPAPSSEQIVLSGGCFWGMEAVFDAVKGVTNVVSGYAGGKKSTAHYELVSTGLTGHAESVQVTFDPNKVSLQQLFAVYFLVAHDPTQLDRQGPDVGSQYRSVIW